MNPQLVSASSDLPSTTLRFWAQTVDDPTELQRQLHLLDLYPEAFDEVWFGSLTGFPALSSHEEYAQRCGAIANEFRRRGLRVSVQITETIGHWGYGAASYEACKNWRPMVGADGRTTEIVPCAADEAFQTYIANEVALYAQAIQPDVVYLDDDFRWNSHGKIQFGCFCESCLQEFSELTHTVWSRETLVAELHVAHSKILDSYLAFHQQKLAEFAARIGTALQKNAPNTCLGLQNCNFQVAYNGRNFFPVLRAMQSAMASPSRVRVGGGAYQEFNPVTLLEKAWTCGMTARAALRAGEVNLAIGEVENYPHTTLGKSADTTALEGALQLACGCNGLSFVLGPYQSKSEAEEGAYFERISQYRSFYERLIEVQKEAAPAGLNFGRVPGHFQNAVDAENPWSWNFFPVNDAINVLQLGIPLLWDEDFPAQQPLLVTAENAPGFGAEDFALLCRNGGVVSGNALLILQERNLTKAWGIQAHPVAPEWQYQERFTASPYNEDMAGATYYYPSVFGQSVQMDCSEARIPVEILAELSGRPGAIQPHAATTILLTTAEGGKIVVVGMPGHFTREVTFAKQRQLQNLSHVVHSQNRYVLPRSGGSMVILPYATFQKELRGVTIYNPTIGALAPLQLELRHLPENARITLHVPASQEEPELEILEQNAQHTLIQISRVSGFEILLLEVE